MSDGSIKEPQENPRQNVNREFPADKQRQEKEFGEDNYYRAARHYFRAAEQFAKSGNVESAARAARPGPIQKAAEMQQAAAEGKSRGIGPDAARGTT